MIKEKSYGPNQLARMFEGNPNMQKVIWSLWREYYGLYLEKYKKKPEYDNDGNLVDPWLINKISDDISYALALGQDNDMNGNRSFALGQGLVTKSFMEIVLGAYNLIPEGQNPTEWIPSDLLLTLGNGPDKDHRSNVFEIFKNGFIKFLSSIKIGEWVSRFEGDVPEDGTIQWTPVNGPEIWNVDHWDKLTHPPVTIAEDSTDFASIDDDQKLHLTLTTSTITVVNDYTTLINVVNNTTVYDLKTQQFYTYINNTWIQEIPKITVTQPAHGFTFGACIKRDGAGNWILAKADTRENAGTVGIVSEVIDADHFRYITGGLLPGEFVDGADYWLSTTIAGAIFIQSDPEIWEIGNVREFIGTGTANGLEVEIDLGDEITEFDLGGGEGASNDVVSGSGMDFETNAPVTLGTPSEVNSTTVNEVTEHSHTHKLGNIDISKITESIIKYGALYNWFAATDSRNIAANEWKLPTINDYQILADYLGASGNYTTNSVGGKLKEIGTNYWNNPNTDATNEVGFNAKASGNRGLTFSNILYTSSFWTTSVWFENTGTVAGLSYNNNYLACVANVGQQRYYGYSIRLIKNSTTLTNGQSGVYIGNDGKIYRTICIGTQEWLADNLVETKYRNGDWIHGYDNGVYTPISNTDWTELTSEAMCLYEDNKGNVIEEIPFKVPEHNKLQGLQGGDSNNNFYGHLTQAQLQLIQSFFDLPTYAGNAEAMADGLQVGNLYKTAIGQLMIVY